MKSVQQKEKEKEDEGVGGGIKRERMERAGEEEEGEEGDAPSPDRQIVRTRVCMYVVTQFQKLDPERTLPSRSEEIKWALEEEEEEEEEASFSLRSNGPKGFPSSLPFRSLPPSVAHKFGHYFMGGSLSLLLLPKPREDRRDS